MKTKIGPPFNSQIHVYDSFFTPVECEEIYIELLETIEQGSQPLPWTNMLLDIKQFVEDKLDIEFNTAMLTKEEGFAKDMITAPLQNGSLFFVQGKSLIGYFYLRSGSLKHTPIINIIFGKI